MRNYQQTKNNPYHLPHDIYMQVKYILLGYDRLKREKLDVLFNTPSPSDGMPHGSVTSNPTADKAEKLSYIDSRITGIDLAIQQVYASMHNDVSIHFDVLKAFWSYDYYNYMHERKDENDEGPSKTTWNRFKSCLSYLVAKNLKLF